MPTEDPVIESSLSPPFSTNPDSNHSSGKNESIPEDNHNNHNQDIDSSQVQSGPITKDSPLTDIATSPPVFDLTLGNRDSISSDDHHPRIEHDFFSTNKEGKEGNLRDKFSKKKDRKHSTTGKDSYESSELSDLGEDSEAETDKMDFLDDDHTPNGEKVSDLKALFELTEMAHLKEVDSDDDSDLDNENYQSPLNNDENIDKSNAVKEEIDDEDHLALNPKENKEAEEEISKHIDQIKNEVAGSTGINSTSVKRSLSTASHKSGEDDDEENISKKQKTDSIEEDKDIPKGTENNDAIESSNDPEKEPDEADHSDNDNMEADNDEPEETSEETENNGENLDEEKEDDENNEHDSTNNSLLIDQAKKVSKDEDDPEKVSKDEDDSEKVSKDEDDQEAEVEDNHEEVEADDDDEVEDDEPTKDKNEDVTQEDIDMDEQRKLAIEELISIESSFAQLRDKLFQDKLSLLEHELQLCLEGSHPELSKIYFKINEFYQDNIKLANANLSYNLKCINTQTIATRTSIHQDYLKQLMDTKNDMITDTTSLWYKINKERNQMDQIVSDYNFSAIPMIPNVTVAANYQEDVSPMPNTNGALTNGVNGSTKPQLNQFPNEYNVDLQENQLSQQAPLTKKAIKQNTLIELVQQRNNVNQQLGILNGLLEFHGLPAAVTSSLSDDKPAAANELLLRKASEDEINDDLRAMGIPI